MYLNISIRPSDDDTDIEQYPVVSYAFQYLNIYEDTSISNMAENNKKGYIIMMTDVIKDFCELNKKGWFHGDLNINCRNMELCKLSDRASIKIIDVDTIKKLIKYKSLSLYELFDLVFLDYIGLCKCLLYNRIIQIGDVEKLQINYIDVIKLFKKDSFIVTDNNI